MKFLLRENQIKTNSLRPLLCENYGTLDLGAALMENDFHTWSMLATVKRNMSDKKKQIDCATIVRDHKLGSILLWEHLAGEKVTTESISKRQVEETESWGYYNFSRRGDHFELKSLEANLTCKCWSNNSILE